MPNCQRVSEGIRIILAFNQEKRLKEFDAINEEHLIYASRSMSLILFLRPAMSLLKPGLCCSHGLLWLLSI